MQFGHHVALLAAVFALGVLLGWFAACVIRPRAKRLYGSATGTAAGASSRRERVIRLQERAAAAAAEARAAYAEFMEAGPVQGQR